MFTIDSDKLDLVLILVNKKEFSTDISDVEAFITADWNEGEEHQDWLDSAPANEIADWILAAQ